jgi:hypothetical protein
MSGILGRRALLGLVSTSGLALLGTSVARVFRGRRAHLVGLAPVINESGSPLPCLFSGLTPLVNFRASFLRNHIGRARDGRCQDPRGADSAVARLLSLLTVRSVHAMDCSSGTCATPYAYPETRECFGGCGGTYEWFYQDPARGYAWRGWQYTSQTVCGGCQCKEDDCWI